MAEHSADAPAEVVQEALRQEHAQSEKERAKYGERLNTVHGPYCQKHPSSTTMSVHPKHRVYHPCGCAHDLPSLPTQSPYSTRRQPSPVKRGKRQRR